MALTLDCSILQGSTSGENVREMNLAERAGREDQTHQGPGRGSLSAVNRKGPSQDREPQGEPVLGPRVRKAEAMRPEDRCGVL